MVLLLAPTAGVACACWALFCPKEWAGWLAAPVCQVYALLEPYQYVIITMSGNVHFVAELFQ